jgi:hypothetical protein
MPHCERWSLAHVTGGKVLMRGHNRTQWAFHVFTMAAGAALLAFPLGPRGAGAACSDIPRVPETFRGAKGSIDRPYVTPGDTTGGPEDRSDRVTLTLDACQPAQAVFDEKTDVVAILFTPPAGGTRNALLLATSCTGVDEPACATQLGTGAKAQCVKTPLHEGSPAGKSRQLWFDVPDLATTSLPNLTGPAAMVVTDKTALRCDIGGQVTPTCKLDSQPKPPLLCIDDLFSDAGCGTNTAHPVFASFTVLPPTNDYRKLCDNGGPAPSCALDLALAFRFTIDKRGTALLPINWRGVLRARGSSGKPCALDDECDTRALEGRTAVEPFSNDPNKTVINLPPGVRVRSFDMRGSEFVPPPSITFGLSADGNELLLEGEAHKGKSIIRIPSCDDRTPCTPNQFFNFTDRLENHVGPIKVRHSGGPGVCNVSGGKRCTTDADCGPGVVCTAFRAFALGQMPRGVPSKPTSVPTPPPPVPTPPPPTASVSAS